MTNKTILIIDEGGPEDYEEDVIRSGNSRILWKEIDPTSGDRVRGYSPNLIVLMTAVSAEVRQRVLEPMTAIGGEIIELY